MRTVFIAAFLLITLAVACNKKVTEASAGVAEPQPVVPTKSIVFGGQESLAVGETLGVEKSKSTLTFVAIVSDNRCPKYVNCITAGEAVVMVAVDGAQPQEVTIDPDPKKVARLTVQGGVFEITGLTPYPEARVKVDPAQRRLQVRVVEAQQM